MKIELDLSEEEVEVALRYVQKVKEQLRKEKLVPEPDGRTEYHLYERGDRGIVSRVSKERLVAAAQIEVGDQILHGGEWIEVQQVRVVPYSGEVRVAIGESPVKFKWPSSTAVVVRPWVP